MFAPILFAFFIAVGAFSQEVCEPGYHDCEHHPYLSHTKRRLG